MKWGFIHEHSVSARSASVEFPCAFPRACRWDPIPKSTHHTALRSARSPQEPIPRVPTTVDRTVDSTRYTPLPHSPAAARLPHATAYTGVHTHSYTICILQKKIQFLQNFSTHGHSPHLSAPVSPFISFTFTDTVHDSINKQISLEPGEVLELLPSHHNSKTIPRFPMAPRL